MFPSIITTRKFYAIGLMSGTSADGIDAALVEIKEKPLKVALKSFYVFSHSKRLRERVLKAFSYQTPLHEFGELNVMLGEAFAAAALELLRKGRIPARQVDFIGSHGQTLCHKPPSQARGKEVPFTLQAGDGSMIAQRTGILSVSDFRAADLAQGGEGAPLVPYVDWRLFTHPRKGRALLNIGGIANFTYLPASAGLNEITGCDTGPGNMLLDLLVSEKTGGKENFDKGGSLAARGRVHPEILRDLLNHPFIRESPPKSADRSFFENLQKKLLKSNLPLSDLLATASAFTAESIAIHLAKFAKKADEIYVSGGGIKNLTLLGAIKKSVQGRSGKKVDFYPFEELGIPAKAKEAVAFAFLAYETLKGRPSNLPNVTGAKKPCILGKISPGWIRKWKLL